MPTLYKAQLVEPETPMVEILDRMATGLMPNAREILDSLDYYNEHNFEIPDSESELTAGEQQGLEPVVGALVEAAVVSVRMVPGPLVATLDKIAKKPHLFFESELPAAVQWELANDYQRDDEKPGTFGMDIWGGEEVVSGYQFQRPIEANIRKAAEAALGRIEEQRAAGRPHNHANAIIALRLGTIFRSSGQSIARRRQPEMRCGKLVFVEGGPFYDFLELVLPTLNRYLNEQGRSPVTTETVVRLVTKGFS
jgi:hypothetical protein